MNVTVVGSGYVGLVVGACLAETGNQVVCADIDERKIGLLKDGESPIYEPGLDRLLQRNLAEGRIRFTTDVAEAVRSGRVVFIAVGTPPDEDGSADLQHVLAVARVVGENLVDEKIVITKSTVPVGTASKVRAEIEKYTDGKFHVCSNPEFLKEGAAIDDFMRPDRVVCGIESDAGSPRPRGTVRAVRAKRQPADLHGYRFGRADQVCGQRDAGNAHQLHEPDCGAV